MFNGGGGGGASTSSGLKLSCGDAEAIGDHKFNNKYNLSIQIRETGFWR